MRASLDAETLAITNFSHLRCSANGCMGTSTKINDRIY